MQVEQFIQIEKMSRKYKVLISGGGTGGHIFPAIAIANEIMSQFPGSEIKFIGAEGRMEMEKVPVAGYEIEGLWISGLQRRLTPKNLSLPFKVISSLWKSRKIIKEFNPDFTVGVGGYASGPLNYTASLLGIPVYLQEQNSFPGITNKLLKNKARKVCVAYEGMERFFPKEKIVITGNPIRQDLLRSDVSKIEAYNFFSLDTEKKTVLIIGGSLGARTINEAMEANLEKIINSNVQILWQTGKSFLGDLGKMPWGNRVTFIKRMDLAYAASDVVVSRAGAMSVSELSALGKPTIFIPSPFVSEDHQTKNAMSLVSKGAALMCKDSEAKEKIGDLLNDVLADNKKLKSLKSEIAKLGLPNASQTIVSEITADFDS